MQASRRCGFRFVSCTRLAVARFTACPAGRDCSVFNFQFESRGVAHVTYSHISTSGSAHTHSAAGFRPLRLCREMFEQTTVNCKSSAACDSLPPFPRLRLNPQTVAIRLRQKSWVFRLFFCQFIKNFRNLMVDFAVFASLMDHHGSAEYTSDELLTPI